MRSKWSLIIPFPSGTDLWSDLIQTIARRLCNHGSDETQTIVQTIVRVRWPLIRLSPDEKCHWSDHLPKIFWPPPDHCPDDCATMAQTIVRVRWPLIRLSPDQKCHWSNHLPKIFWPPPDHCPDDCATMAPTKPRPFSRQLLSQMISNQTIPKQKCHYSDTFLGEIWSGQGASLMWTRLLTQTYNSI